MDLKRGFAFWRDYYSKDDLSKGGLGMANISVFFEKVILRVTELWRDQHTLLVVLLSCAVFALLVALYSALMRRRRLNKLRRILQDDSEYARLFQQTRENLWAMEKIVVASLSKLSEKDKKKISCAFQLDGPNCQEGLRKIMEI
jgi:hypothetical protein